MPQIDFDFFNCGKLQNIKGFLELWGKELPTGKWELSTDSRKIEKDQVFLALKGENFNGLNFIPEVLKKGSNVVIYEASETEDEELKKSSLPEATFIRVSSTLSFLQSLGRLWRDYWKNSEQVRTLIGLTGSNGKTTHKNMIYSFLDGLYPGKIFKTPGNFNNHIGVPLTLLSLKEFHQFGVIEMGTNHPGEIPFLVEMVDPDIGMVTNIGPSHLEFFIEEKEVFKEKRSLLDYLFQRDRTVLVNFEDRFLKTWVAEKGENKNVFTYGSSPQVHFRFEIDKRESKISILDQKKGIYSRFSNQNFVGHHNHINLVGSFLMAALSSGGNRDSFCKIAPDLKPSANRSFLKEIQGKTVFMDAYNANPGSMKASLQGFMDYCNKNQIPHESCFYILGDMNELGEKAPDYHSEMGHYLNHLGVENMAFIGQYGVKYREGAGGKGLSFSSKEEFLKYWKLQEKNYRYIFLKGSRSLQLESIID